jgi:RNA polymerase sigma-70 factor, ECF subfamily
MSLKKDSSEDKVIDYILADFENGKNFYRLTKNYAGYWGVRRDFEDIYQNFLIKILEKSDKFDFSFNNKNNINAWCFKVFENTLRDYQRKEKRQKLHFVNESSLTDYPGSEKFGSAFDYFSKNKISSPLTNLIKEETRKKVRFFLCMLNSPNYTLLEQRYFQEMSYSEIAEKRNMPMGSVKSHLFNAKQNLLNIIGEENLKSLVY